MEYVIVWVKVRNKDANRKHFTNYKEYEEANFSLVNPAKYKMPCLYLQPLPCSQTTIMVSPNIIELKLINVNN